MVGHQLTRLRRLCLSDWSPAPLTLFGQLVGNPCGITVLIEGVLGVTVAVRGNSHDNTLYTRCVKSRSNQHSTT